MKILFLGDKFSTSLGGIETFQRTLIENFSNEHEFYEMALNNVAMSSQERKIKNVFSGNDSLKFVYDKNLTSISKWESTYNLNSVEKEFKMKKFVWKIIDFFKIRGLAIYWHKKVLALLNLKTIKKSEKAINDFIMENKIDVVVACTRLYRNYNIRIKNINCAKKVGVLHFNVRFSLKKYKIKYVSKNGVDMIKPKNIFGRIGKEGIDQFDSIVTSNVIEKNELIKNGINENKIKVANYFFTSSKKEINLKEKTLISFVGRLEQSQKNIIGLNEVAKKIPNLQIHIFGDGDGKKYINSQNIVLEGPKSRTELNEVYKKTKILVLTSSFEGTPYVITEAQEYGVIVVAFNTFFSCNWTLGEGRGFLISPFDYNLFAQTITEIMNMDLDAYSKVVQKNQDFVTKNYSKENYISQWTKILTI